MDMELWILIENGVSQSQQYGMDERVELEWLMADGRHG